jgi:predicted RNase H-like nuclease (RuvC/YqgF family)
LEEQISALEVKLQEKQKERDDLEKKLSYLKQENQLAKDLIQRVQNCEKEKLMKQEVESTGIFSWLPSWGSTSNQQDPSN